MSLGRLLNTIINIVLASSVSIAIFLLFSPFKPFIVLSDSMAPIINRGDIIIGSRIGGTDDVEKGGIYSYKDEESGCLITHRLITENGQGYVFKGDNNKKPDRTEIKRDQILYHIVDIRGTGGLWEKLKEKSLRN